VKLVCLSWVSEAVDHLLRRIQYDDASGASLKDVLDPKTNPFMHAQSKLSDMATLPLESGPLRCVAHHYADADAETRQLVQDTCFNMSVSLTVQIGHYFDELTGFPFKLAKAVDPRFSEEEQRAVVEEFFRSPLCDLDLGMSKNGADNFPTRIL